MAELNTSIPMIHSCMESCMRKIGAVTKDSQMNAQTRGQNIQYAYRSIDAVYNALQPAMVESGITVVPQVLEYQRIPKDKSNENYQNTVICKMSFKWTAADGSYVETVVVNEGQDAGDKAFSKAMANCFKYACFTTFVIPTQEMDTFDPDHYRPEVDNERMGDKQKETKKKPLKERIAEATKETEPEEKPEAKKPKAESFDRRSCINLTASKVGYPQGLNTEEAKVGFGCMVMEVIKAGKCVNKKTGDMTPEELQQCMRGVVEMFGSAS